MPLLPMRCTVFCRKRTVLLGCDSAAPVDGSAAIGRFRKARSVSLQTSWFCWAVCGGFEVLKEGCFGRFPAQGISANSVKTA